MPTPQDDGSLLDEPRGPGPGETSTTTTTTTATSQTTATTTMSPEEETAAPPAALMAASRQADDERRVTSPPSGSKYLHDDVAMTTTLAEDEAAADGQQQESAARQPSHEADDSWGNNDVEKFDGKIVYNPDGSAYIIEDSELSEEEMGDGCIVDGRGVSLPEQSQVFPQIANAFYVSRNPALYSALYGQQQQQQHQQQQQAALASRHQAPEAPVMHSYRVYSVRDCKAGEDGDKEAKEVRKQLKIPAQEATSVPVKPILMCFICKLSFGYTKSFVAHAMGDHNLVLRDDEKEILGHQNASAIIQVVGKEKEPLLSFLEPVPPSRPSAEHGADREHRELRDRDDVEAQSLVVHRRSVDRSSASPQRPTPQQSPQQHRQHVPETSPVSLPQNGSNSSNNFLNFNHQRLMVNGLNSVMDLTRKSPVGGSASHGRNSVSPGASPSPSPLQLANPFAPPPPSFLTGTTIGVCPDHIAGRPSGVECSKCELILSSSRLGGPLANMHSRNSCKTLKCPKCNWHYKYQETLEIHMKEKHPETETSCLYCIAGQPHPRLARGETYTCGYKPYRCEVCNYSTTTKGNLSIHMQSDKHLNNMQELQNGGVSAEMTHPALQTPPPKSGMASPSVQAQQAQQKPKPTFRCDVCNYETNVARNLRIHMTSEKHTHNMMVLQQSMKHMQTLSALQQSHQQQLSLESLLHFHPGLLPGGLPDKPPPHSEAALADMAYNQALLIQMMTGGQMPPHIPPELAPHMDMGLNPETMEPPPGPADPNPSHLFHCCVCNAFSTDSLEQLGHHLSEDRTRIREQEILAVVAGHYVCKLCSYKTNLKANFQLHCKTDKHLQRLQHVNHVKEGGPRNEWKLKYVTSPGGIQVRCHACDYYTNSAHKLQLHAAGQRHEASHLLFRHLRESESALEPAAQRLYHCALCGFSARARLPLLQHIRSMKHVQMEQLHQLQRRAEGKDVQTDIGEIFQVLAEPQQPFADMDCDNKEQQQLLERERERERENRERGRESRERERERSRERDSATPQDSSPATDGAHQCPYCNFTAASELRVQAHVLAHHQNEPTSPSQRDFLCPLCQDAFRDRALLERHVMQIHSVNAEGLQRLLMLVDQSHWLNSSTRPGPGTPSSQRPTTPQTTPPGNLNSPSSVASSTGCKELQDSASSGKLNHSDNTTGEVDDQDMADDQDDLLRCHACSKSFRAFEELCAHQTEANHLELKQTPLGPGYLCWKKGCNQYFPSATSLQMHFREIHLRGGAQPGVAVSEKHVYKYRCSQCSLAFKTMEKLQLHSQYHLIRDATKCVLCGRSFRSILALHKHVESAHPELTEEELNAYKQSLMNNPLVLAGITGPVLDPVTNELLRKESMRMDDDAMESEESPAKENADDSLVGNAHNDGENSDDSIVYKEQQFLEDYLNSQAMAEDSYNDPNRKYKCHRCKVAYTRQSYLTSHNKTLLHRKGEKLTYPMEKYLDPNRPYKCDVCKESFTQKNILLVHYNSVSHLHKLKRAMQEQQNNNNNNNNTKDTLSSLGVTSPQSLPPGMPLTPKSQSSSASDDDDKKPYKCNICRVAYSQGSTLDIHMRSVLHQTRASKLQDLAITGQIDLSKPLIEQPEPRSKLIQDILGASPKLAPPQSLSSSLTSPPSGGSTGTAQGSPTVPSSLGSSSASAQSSVIGSDPLACPRCSALFASQEQLATHQQLYCLFGSPMNMFGMGGASPQSSNNRTPPPFQSTPEDTFARLSVNKKSSQMYKHLLESFGFDLVMQFNENHQRRRQKEREDMEKAQLQLQEQAEHQAQQQLEPPMAMEIQEPEKVEEIEEEPKEQKEVVVKEEQPDEEVRPSTPSEKDQLPEVSKSTCQHCNKEFSSVWVLKAHCEEVHKDLVPLDFLEKYAQQFKSEYEKKSGPGLESTPEKEPEDSKENIKANLLTPPNDIPATPTAPSTPTASSTPASSSEGAAASNSSTTALPAMAGLSPSAQGLSMNLAQQMDSMQMALNAMAVQQHLQQQLNPMMLGMMGLPLGLNMQALAAMNLQPPLVPLMMPPPPFDPMAAQNPLFSPQGQGMGDPAAMLAKQQQALMQQQQQVVNASQQKRARTRITDEQLKILRAHFDINNSPSEEQIHDMAARSGLPPKVIKHWFRNTLFKERQRNKDSPYNFNNPPSTTLNLEEYEKTGEAKVTPLNTSSSSDEQKPVPKPVTPAPPPSQPAPPPPQPPKPNPGNQQQREREQLLQQQQMQQQMLQQQQQHVMQQHQFPKPPEHIKTEPNTEHVGMEREDYHLSPTPSHASRSSSPASLTLSSLIASQLGPDPMSHGAASMLPPKLTPPNFASPTHGVAPGPMTPNSRSVSPGRSFNDPFTHLGSNNSSGGSGGGANSSGSSSSGGSTGKRANRTRFTDYQIKVLQEFFENNAYPKDDDLEYLSKLLSLSPRVIVVWFQNARQKARKVYENQPAVDPAPGTGGTTDEQGRFQRTPGLNYQCKKCLLVFQRYYELIRHQKTHCFKEEDAKRSAQAQAAAAQIAAVMSSEDSNSSTMTEQREAPAAPQSAPQASTAALTVSSGPVTPAPGSSAHTPTPSPIPEPPRDPPSTPVNQALSKESSFQCDKCNLVFPRFELWREHQLVHIMNPNLFPTYPPDSPFGILQQHAQLQQQQQQQVPQQPQLPVMPDLSMLPGAAAHPLVNMMGAKRKLEDFDEPQEHSDQPKDKRLRTTILPEQLDYLYQKYQMESNPSRKMLENIAREVGLKKRVVQVWFQNTRARERKGQSRAHSQVINKRCPFCPALFKVKSALESHLNTKHADQCARGEINIDALPDEEVSMESTQSSQHSSAQPNMMPPLFPPFQSPDVEASLKKYYEESVKRYISELQAHQTSQNGKEGAPTKEDAAPLPGAPPMEGPVGVGVLDLSKPVDLSRPLGMALSVREDPMSEHGDDSMSECTDNMDDESNPTSPASSTQSGHQRSAPAPGQPGQPANKRFRTQMSSLQVKIMKSLFADYKTPTMAECEMLGREIGLAKRVVQVWFQNARAKEKKTKLALQKALGGPESLATPPPDRAPEECVHCQFKYSHKYSIQDHIFTKKHIENVRLYLETHKDAQPGSEPAPAEFPMPQLPVPGNMAAAMAGPTPSDNNNAPKAVINTLPQDDLNLLQQLYGSVAPSTAGRSFYHNNGVEGSLVTMLGLEPAVLQVVLDQTGPGVSSVRIAAPEEPPPHCRAADAEAGFVCKKCRLAFSAEVALIGHQRGCCPGQVGWAVRLMASRYECKLCPGAAFDKACDARRHCESDAHRGRMAGMQPPPPPDSPSTALSHEMEDVVNQIAALAAKAAQEGTADSNANIFCQQDGGRKGPGPVAASCPPPFAVPSTGL